MVWAVLLTLLVLSRSAAGGSARASERPTLLPLFSNVADGPGFLVDCLNETGGPVSSLAALWPSALRFDGRVLEYSGGMGSGRPSTVLPGETWRGIVVLRQTSTGYVPGPKYGARVRISYILPIEEGRHTFAVRCGASWSDDLEFYWEAGKPGHK